MILRNFKIQKLNSIFLLGLIVFISSCLPPDRGGRELDDQGEVIETQKSDLPESNVSTFAKNYIQNGSEISASGISIAIDFNDALYLRGNNLSSYLSQISLNTSLCLPLYFPNNNDKKVVIVSPIINKIYNSTLKQFEFYLKVFPNDQDINESNCQTVDLIGQQVSLRSIPSTDITFKLDELCSSCLTNQVANNFDLYFNNGQIIQEIDLDHLSLTIQTNTTTNSNPTSSCLIDSHCSQDYDCCLQGQCVNHAAVRPETDTNSSEYLGSVAQILNNPGLLTNYAHLYFVCPNLINEDSGENNGGPTENEANAAAEILKNELEDYYLCLNRQDDEYSYCSIYYEDASDLINGGTYTFTNYNSDITFSGINSLITADNIVEIDYGGVTLYKENEVALGTNGTINAADDKLDSAQTVDISYNATNQSYNDTLKIRFKIDGTCEEIGTSLARCTKYYTFGRSSTPAMPADHDNVSKTFSLPYYANLAYSAIIKIDNITVPAGSSTWSTSGDDIIFDSSYDIYDNQDLEITYYVTDDATENFTVNDLMEARNYALGKVQEYCNCDGAECNIKPNEDNENDDFFSCVYPEPDNPDPLLQATVYLSTRSAATAYFNEDGVYYDYADFSTATTHEGEEFSYVNYNPPNRPNNQSNAVGFNEIYGSMGSGFLAIPAMEIEVVKNKVYDLYTDNGTFSQCTDCSSSYESNFVKFFPFNTNYRGAGYFPSSVESRRKGNLSSYPADDKLFGRACFVPATMIPWTHQTQDSIPDQRTNRRAAQHFLFANGYNRDWYGFDYGSLIGSYDGMTWFSVGNSRRTKAKSNKLFLAVNAYFSDLTLDNTYKVIISEMAPIINSGSEIEHDLESDGAECQRYHMCDTDQDCLTQLGYDYVCQNVGTVKTPWPVFDINGLETIGSTDITLMSLVGGTNGGSAKRCVYRGKGAICHQNPFNITATNSYTKTQNTTLNVCSLNNYCEDLGEDRFNDRIARYGIPPAAQNVSSYITTDSDTYGLAARVLGRPFSFFGEESVDTDVQTQLNANNVNSICIPGKNPSGSATTANLNDTGPTDANRSDSADKIFNIGKTYVSTINSDDEYLSACPGIDSNGYYSHTSADNLSSTNQQIYGISNNFSTNLFTHDAFSNSSLFNDTSTLITQEGINTASCLRTAGAPCFTDAECAPNRQIYSKAIAINDWQSMNEAEQQVWKEELTCASTVDRYLISSTSPNPEYDLTEQKCCRETGNNFTFYSQPHQNSDFTAFNTTNGEPLVPGINLDINSNERYSRINTIYDLLTTDSLNYPALIYPSESSASTTMTNYNTKQYNTLDVHNQRMCCSGSWVREFASGANANTGGHYWTNSRQQRIDKASFKRLNWLPDNGIDFYLDNAEFECTLDNWETAACEIRNILPGSAHEENFLNFFGLLELVGVPQVLIPSTQNQTNSIALTVGESQESITQYETAVEGTIVDLIDEEKIDATYSTVHYYSAANYDNFQIEAGKLKKVFSENKFACCLPAGTEVESTDDDDVCCTGFKGQIDGTVKCCLEDYTNLSVYTNRYISSEGSGLTDSEYDPLTGFIKNKETVLQKASTMCCSGNAAYGVAISDDLPIPLEGAAANLNAKTRRFVMDDELDNQTSPAASYYDIGLRWNHQVYCVPAGYNSGGGSGSTGQ
ncbi:hypothetical protein N9N67_06835 [Bacteriovoracaceae bacterium]|nr:hypothetical protein [Bacteriovoracaceae bacterium]